MKEIVRICMNSIKKKLVRKEKRFGFELIGFDFMIDTLGNLFLIEANTNPCIEESCPYL